MNAGDIFSLVWSYCMIFKFGELKGQLKNYKEWLYAQNRKNSPKTDNVEELNVMTGRYLMEIYKNCSKMTIYGETGWYPLYVDTITNYIN